MHFLNFGCQNVARTEFLRDIFSHRTPCGRNWSLAILQVNKNAAFFKTYVVGFKILMIQPRKLAWLIQEFWIWIFIYYLQRKKYRLRLWTKWENADWRKQFALDDTLFDAGYDKYKVNATTFEFTNFGYKLQFLILLTSFHTFENMKPTSVNYYTLQYLVSNMIRYANYTRLYFSTKETNVLKGQQIRNNWFKNERVWKSLTLDVVHIQCAFIIAIKIITWFSAFFTPTLFYTIYSTKMYL